MAITLSNLKPSKGHSKKRKRIGRGNASGTGTYAGKGLKGQKARSGGSGGLKRLGLKMITQRIPKKRGFTSIHKRPAIINVGELNIRFENGSKITPAKLVKADLIQNAKAGVKILGNGEISKSFTFHGFLVSKSAKEKIEKAGGKLA